MKSGGPWNLRGLRPEARSAAREAARRAGLSVGEWLNTVIQPSDEEDDAWWGGAPDRDPDDGWRPRSRYQERDRDRYREAPPPWRDRDRYDDAPPPPRGHERYRDAPPPWRERDRYQDAPPPWRERGHDDDMPPRRRRERYEDEADERPVRRPSPPNREEPRAPGGAPYREQSRAAAGALNHPEPPRREPPPRDEGARRHDAGEDRDPSIDRAIAEIEARQRALATDPAAASGGGQRAFEDHDPAAEIRARQRALEADPGAEIEPRQHAFPDQAPPARSFSEREPQPFPSPPEPSYPSRYVEQPALDLSGLEEQLRGLTARIETLRPGADLQTAIDSLRNDLAEIGHTLTEALPRRAVESLEIEVKALAQRIDHSRESGVDRTMLASVEHGLQEVREALHGLTPAENLIGFNEAVHTLANKVDAIVARDDPATLQQLETAIGALRGIVSHVASNDTLSKVADDVRTLAAKVDGLANNATNLPSLTAIENRIDSLTGAINASTEAGHAVPRELEKLLSGLIEKLEWVQLTHTDHTALAHLEDRIATLVKRLDASDARLGLLEGVERGLADLLVYIEQLRNSGGASLPVATSPPVPAVPVVIEQVIEQEFAEIKETERRTQDTLEDMHGTVEQVVDRLATIESDLRGDKVGDAAPESPAEPVEAMPPSPPEQSVDEAAMTAEATEPTPALEPQPAMPRSVLPGRARMPIDPSLPPDHPLEPGSTANRNRAVPSAADRIAASEAAVGSKPPVIPDPGGGRPDFVAAARRAAKAAAIMAEYDKPNATNATQSAQPAKKLGDRIRTLAVAGAVVVIIVGGFHIVSRLFTDGGSNPPPVHTEAPRPHDEPKPLPTERPQVKVEPQADTAPEANPANAPAVISRPPVADPSPSLSPPPGTMPSPQTNTDSGQQSSLTPGGADSSGSPAGVGTATLPLPLDITGALPKSSTSGRSMIVTSPGGTDRLPVAIGGPALRNAALAGDPYAAYEVAVRFAEGRVVPANNLAAVHWFDIAAKKGLAPAQFRLGGMYEKGLGVRKDLIMARTLYRAAADKGHGKAMHNLAVLYAEGVDGKADYRTAARWFRKAADHGIADSQYNLAVLYARGVGVEQNFAESYKWFFLAAKDGDADAAQKRDEVAAHLDPQALAAARQAAEKWSPLPQPADAITIKGAWDAPAKETVKPKARSSAKAAAPDAAKLN